VAIENGAQILYSPSLAGPAGLAVRTYSEPDHVPKYRTELSIVFEGGMAEHTEPSARSLTFTRENFVFDMGRMWNAG